MLYRTEGYWGNINFVTLHNHKCTKCGLCGVLFTSSQKFISHKCSQNRSKTSSYRVNSKATIHTCPECKKVFSSHQNLLLHQYSCQSKGKNKIQRPIL